MGFTPHLLLLPPSMCLGPKAGWMLVEVQKGAVLPGPRPPGSCLWEFPELGLMCGKGKQGVGAGRGRKVMAGQHSRQ